MRLHSRWIDKQGIVYELIDISIGSGYVSLKRPEQKYPQAVSQSDFEKNYSTAPAAKGD